MRRNERKEGRVDVFVGPMFSGKTDYLIVQLKRAVYGGLKPKAFKPWIDDRGEGAMEIRSKSGLTFPARSIRKAFEIVDRLNGETMVAIDEAQFLDSGIVEVVKYLARGEGKRVVISGLPNDFRGEPFGSMPELLAIADHRLSFTAICTFEETKGVPCGNEATRTQRLINGKPAHWNSPIILVGGEEAYAARCPRHHIVPGRPTRIKLINQ